MYESVLSLAHYFDCAVVLSRAEDNLLLVAKAKYSAERYLHVCNVVWPCFLLAVKFDLRRVKAACMPRLAVCCAHNGDQA